MRRAQVCPTLLTRAAALALLVGTVPVGDAAAAEPVSAREQMVVAANPHASEAGIRMLRAGGSAVDAAIAVQLILSMVEPQSSGIGGGAFLLYFDPTAGADREDDADDVTVYAGRETAPAGAGPDMFLDGQGRPAPYRDVGFGGVPVGVPGVMRMLELAHRDHGRLEWSELFEPAIELAEAGFEVSPRLYFLLDRFAGIAQAPEFIAHYYDADGAAWPTGHLLKNPDYAQTLRLLASDGADAIYTGALAPEIVARVNDNPVSRGSMTLEDLAAYRPEKAAALCSPYREYRVCGPRLPSSGGIAVQQILAIVEPFDLAAARNAPARFVHLVAEAGRLAFADRNFYLADPEFVDVPAEGLMNADYLRERSSLITPERAMPTVSHGEPPSTLAFDFASSRRSELKSTSHFSIVDRFGGAVSMTTSVQGAFGSQLMVGGFILNNQLTDFSDEPTIDGRPVANRAAGGKRPLSSMSPTIVLDDRSRPYLLMGSPGGTRIINYVAQAVLSVIDLGMNVQEAVESPHFVSQGGAIELEEGTELVDMAEALEALGHRTRARNLNSGLHGIVIDYDPETGAPTLFGGVDPRREGVALGD